MGGAKKRQACSMFQSQELRNSKAFPHSSSSTLLSIVQWFLSQTAFCLTLTGPPPSTCKCNGSIPPQSSTGLQLR